MNYWNWEWQDWSCLRTRDAQGSQSTGVWQLWLEEYVVHAEQSLDNVKVFTIADTDLPICNGQNKFLIPQFSTMKYA